MCEKQSAWCTCYVCVGQRERIEGEDEERRKWRRGMKETVRAMHILENTREEEKEKAK